MSSIPRTFHSPSNAVTAIKPDKAIVHIFRIQNIVCFLPSNGLFPCDADKGALRSWSLSSFNQSGAVDALLAITALGVYVITRDKDESYAQKQSTIRRNNEYITNELITY